MACANVLFRAVITTLLASAAAFSSPSVDVELDPTDFILGGYRIHVGYIQNTIRCDLGVVSVKIPKVFHGNDQFDYEIFGVVARMDYLFDSYEKWFVGIEGTWMKNTYTHITTNASETRHPFLLATRIGYRFAFLDHLTVTPWVGLGALLNKGNEYVVDGDRFKVSTFNVFPTVHVGWAF
ncbi:MAG TPA: hypothetical protein VJ385_19475 [Fibrobacteria bacterium]|nr:hypothetical protein [Fibrobacteria bacterium]